MPCLMLAISESISRHTRELATKTNNFIAGKKARVYY